jgi:uroporphyrinogen decarboxylase
MKSRDRALTALNHREADRIPIDLGSSIVTSITRNAYVDLKRFLGMPLEEIKMLDHVQQLPYVDEELLKRFEVDFRIVQLPPATASALHSKDEGEYWAFLDRWGAKLHMPKENGYYYDWVEFAMKEASLAALEKFQWPAPDPLSIWRICVARLGIWLRILSVHNIQPFVPAANIVAAFEPALRYGHYKHSGAI